MHFILTMNMQYIVLTYLKIILDWDKRLSGIIRLSVTICDFPLIFLIFSHWIEQHSETTPSPPPLFRAHRVDGEWGRPSWM